MRAMMTAGPALERDNVAAYNCAFMNIDRIKAFSEILYILCCGTGVGFSVERQHVAKLPEVPSELHPSPTTIVVPDSKIGWATSFHELLSLLYAGKIPNIDYSQHSSSR
jgi:ribonucleoside-triphosphate reductase